MKIAEVVETKMAYKSGQTDEKGNTLPLGTLQIRLGGNELQGQVINHYARPATFNKRIPLIGEHVMVFTAPVHDYTSAEKSVRYLYLAPYNATDDISLNAMPKGWGRSVRNPIGGSRLSDKEQPGYTFPKRPKSRNPLQPFEGDDLWQGRFGQSIRFSSHIQTVNSPGKGVYSKKPTWKGKSNGDPIMVLAVNKGTSPPGTSYDIEDLSKDDSSIYLTSTHKLRKLKAGFKKNRDVMQAANYNKTPQIVIDSERVVMNARKDIAMIIAKKEAILTSDVIRFQTSKYNVSLDDLMDWLNDLAKQLWQLTTGAKQFSTPAGPTLTATNVSEVTKIHQVDFKKNFKIP